MRAANSVRPKTKVGNPLAINGNQWQSMAINGNQWQSVAISGNQWQSGAGHHLQVLKEGGELGERWEGEVLNARLALALFGAASAAAPAAFTAAASAASTAAASAASTAAASAASAAATPSIVLFPLFVAFLLGCLFVGKARHPNFVGLWPLAT